MATNDHARTLILTRSFRTTIHQRHTIDLNDYTVAEADQIWRHATGGESDDLDPGDVDDLVLKNSDEGAEEWDWISDPVYTIGERAIIGPLPE